MNNLLQIREKTIKAKKLYEAKLLATKNREVTSYRRSIFEERINQAKKEMRSEDSKNQFIFYC